MSDPIVTIVITTHNRGELAYAAVDSALAQTISDIEVIVVDDSSDEPFDWNGGDPRVLVIRRDRCGGVCAARNAGLAAARGRWITFLDDDDELLPEMLEKSLFAIERSELPPPVAALSGMELVDSLGLRIERWLPVTIPKGRDFFLEGSQQGEYRATNTLVVPTQIVRDIGGWDEHMRSAERHDFFLRLNSVCSLDGTSEVTYRMTAHDGARTSKNALDCASDMERTVQMHHGTFVRHPRRFAHFLGSMGILYLKAGRWGPAFWATTRAVARDPKRLKLYRWWLASLGGPRLLASYRGRKRLRAAIAPVRPKDSA